MDWLAHSTGGNAGKGKLQLTMYRGRFKTKLSEQHLSLVEVSPLTRDTGDLYIKFRYGGEKYRTKEADAGSSLQCVWNQAFVLEVVMGEDMENPVQLTLAERRTFKANKSLAEADLDIHGLLLGVEHEEWITFKAPGQSDKSDKWIAKVHHT